MLDSTTAADLVAVTEQVMAMAVRVPTRAVTPVEMAGEALEETLLRLGVPLPGQGDDT